MPLFEARVSWPDRLRQGLPVTGVVAGLLLAGSILQPFVQPAWEDIRAERPELKVDGLEALGQGALLGVLSGFRAIVADFVWLRAAWYWERLEPVKTTAYIRLATRVDPRPSFFWMNGARMIAYDMPVWAIRDAGGFTALPAAEQEAIRHDYARRALALLEEAEAYHPDALWILLERAQIWNNRLNDWARAAELYRQAAERPKAPFYAARLYAELLRNHGRPAEAYAYLKALYPTLPDNRPEARKPVVLKRIRALEDQLEIPVWERFKAD
ncbi:MAG: tetratricopeptide repeat protein [Opitutales bacterium]